MTASRLHLAAERLEELAADEPETVADLLADEGIASAADALMLGWTV